MIGLVSAVMMTLTMQDLKAEFPTAGRDKPIVGDAIGRWTKKMGSSASMTNRFPIVFYLKTKRCVVLQLRATAVGGSPAYCYHLADTILVEAADDVE